MILAYEHFSTIYILKYNYFGLCNILGYGQSVIVALNDVKKNHGEPYNRRQKPLNSED